MKKTYLKPDVEIMKFQQANIIVTSPTVKDGPIDPTKPNLGRDRWDDDDDF